MPTDKKQVPAAVETQRLHDYDLVLIVSPELADDALETTIKGISQFITSKDGVIAGTERWGKKKLAYPLKRSLEGYYVLIKFKMNAAWSKELEASLQISEKILRHLLIRLGD